MKTMLLLFFWSFIALAQTPEALKPETKKIHGANYNMDFDAVVALTYPKMYEETGKNAFAIKLDSDYQNEHHRMRLEIENPVFQYSEIKKADGKSFCVITYKNPVRYFYESKLDSRAMQQQAAELKQSTKAYEVVPEPKRNSINVKRNSKLIAIADETTQNQWKFLNMDDPAQRDFFEKTFTPEVKKMLGF